MSYTENLDGYEKMKDTESCYLDGRYFQKVFVRYPGLISEPLNITIREKRNTKFKEQKERFYVSMKEANIDTNYPGLLRVVITTPKSRHSNLLILDYENGIAHRFEPLGSKAPYFDKVNDLIEEYLGIYFDIQVSIININDEKLDEKNRKCLIRGNESGFCTAYNILYAYAYLNNKDFNPSNIRKFASMIEQTYGSLPREGAEIEMGLFGNPNPNQGRNMAIGGIGGLAIGGLLAGGTGAVLGGVGGLAIGSLI